MIIDLHRPSYRRLALVVLLVAATAITLVHWHKDLKAQHCEICHVRHSPNVVTPIDNLLCNDLPSEWNPATLESAFELEDVVPITPGRAPSVDLLHFITLHPKNHS